MTRRPKRRASRLWIASTQGIFHVHQGRTDTFGSADGLSGDVAYRLVEDHEGNVWVATGSGLDRFREYAIPTVSRGQGLSTSTTWTVLASADGAVWIGTLNGLNRWRDGHVTVYGQQTDMGIGTRGLPQRSKGGLASVAHGIGLDSRGQLCVSTQDGIFGFEGDHFAQVRGAPAGNVWSIAGDGKGKLWVNDGTAGLYYFAPGETTRPTPWSRFGQKGLGATAMLPDPKGGLWLGFWDGGIAHFKDGEVRTSYSAADGLGSGRATDLRFGSRGTLWAATEGGLSRIRDGRVMTLASKNGLPCDTVHWSMEDDEHFVWLYMSCGLVRIARSELDAWVADPAHKVLTRVFDASDGVILRSNLGGYGPHVSKAPDGRIWFAPYDGVSVIDPKHLPLNNIPPPVHVEQVIADHKTYQVPAGTSESVGLPALIRDLRIDYTALSLVAPEKVQFAYKLEGFDNDWQDAGNRRQAFYTNLPPKSYTFRVKACNNSGVWNEAGTTLNFSVAPAYYQALWFQSLCVLGLAGIVWSIYSMRVRHVAALYKGRMEERLEERERIARDLHDTFLQSVQGLVLKFDGVSKQIPTEQSARKAMENALDLADEVLAEGRSRVRNLRDATESLSDLPVALRRVAEESPENHQTEFKAVVEGNARELHPMVLEESYCIGREALMNALSHSGGLHIEAEITYDARQFRLRIRDDGRGIDPAILEHGGKTGHWGLQGMRERAQRIGGQLEFWSRPGTGTEVELRVPGGTAYRASGTPSKRMWFARALDRGKTP